jgi:hypothetical protein
MKIGRPIRPGSGMSGRFRVSRPFGGCTFRVGSDTPDWGRMCRVPHGGTVSGGTTRKNATHTRSGCGAVMKPDCA